MEKSIAQTGENSFHLLLNVLRSALEILRRKLASNVVDQHSVRKKVSLNLCLLLKLLVVSPFLADSNRFGSLIKTNDKGVTVEQVAKVTNFTEAGVMVHAC
jgi:hypothetical protein